MKQIFSLLVIFLTGCINLPEIEGPDKDTIIQLDTGTDGGGEAKVCKKQNSGNKIVCVDVEIYMSNYYTKMKFNSNNGVLSFQKQDLYLSGKMRGDIINIYGRKNIPLNYLYIYDRILKEYNSKEIQIEDLLK